MKIDCLALGAYQTNCYVLRRDETNRDCLVVDAGLEAEPLVEFLMVNGLNPLAVILTHGHVDHIAGVQALRGRFPDIKVYIHRLDAEMLTGTKPNLSELTGGIFKTGPADNLVSEGDIIDQAQIKLQVLHTPGHTAGGISLYCEEQGIVFVGDIIFADSIGRTDFAGGNMTELIGSIKQKLLTLPEETILYPGHGPQTTIGREKRYNPFL